MELLRLRREDFRERTDCNGNKTGELEVYKRGKGGIERWCLVNPAYNELQKLKSVLAQINLTQDDELIVLGDVFDRGGYDADPIGGYFALSGIQGKYTWIRGNHDQ